MIDEKLAAGEAGEISIKRVYSEPSSDDGFRVLVDRLWPRGMTHERARIDEWLKDVAPSPSLRKWWGHNPETMEEFAAKYVAELDENPAVEKLREILFQNAQVTLVFAAKDLYVNHARVLKEYMEKHM